MLTLARAGDNVLASKHTQPLGNRRHRFAFHGRQFTYATVALSKPGSKTQPRGIPKRPEEPRRLLQRRFAYQ
jgi:hypothetical protein